MFLISTLAQLAVATSIFIVWIFRFHNVEREFQEFGLSTTIRNGVGVAKTSLSSLLVLGIWYQELVLWPALLLAFFMICAQYFHYSVANSLRKRLPSFCLLALCLLIIIIKCATI